MQNFEIGCVYTRRKEYFLAVDTATLFTFREGKAVTLPPNSRMYVAARETSVAFLCEEWEVSSKELDAATMSFMSLAPTQTAPRGTKARRRDTDKEEALWEAHRMVSLAV